MSVTVQALLGTRHGKTDASDARGGVSTRSIATGAVTRFPGARTRLFRVHGGVATHVIEGRYTAQSAAIGVGALVQSGQNFLPLPLGPATFGHAWGYDLSVESVPLY